MNTIHKLRIAATCPVDGTLDIYDVIVETDEVIPVEGILAAVAGATHEPRYQEQITQSLADLIDATVTTIGRHSNVETTCTAEPEGKQ